MTDNISKPDAVPAVNAGPKSAPKIDYADSRLKQEWDQVVLTHLLLDAAEMGTLMLDRESVLYTQRDNEIVEGIAERRGRLPQHYSVDDYMRPLRDPRFTLSAVASVLAFGKRGEIKGQEPSQLRIAIYERVNEITKLDTGVDNRLDITGIEGAEWSIADETIDLPQTAHEFAWLKEAVSVSTAQYKNQPRLFEIVLPLMEKAMTRLEQYTPQGREALSEQDIACLAPSVAVLEMGAHVFFNYLLTESKRPHHERCTDEPCGFIQGCPEAALERVISVMQRNGDYQAMPMDRITALHDRLKQFTGYDPHPGYVALLQSLNGLWVDKEQAEFGNRITCSEAGERLRDEDSQELFGEQKPLDLRAREKVRTPPYSHRAYRLRARFEMESAFDAWREARHALQLKAAQLPPLAMEEDGAPPSLSAADRRALKQRAAAQQQR